MRKIALSISVVSFAAIAVLTVLAFSLPAKAAFFEPFDTNPVLSSTEADGVWYTDRFAPAGFESEFFAGDNRLALTLSEDDSQANRPLSFASSFYDTQGRKFNLPDETINLSIDFFIDSAFENITEADRIGGLWATGVDAGDAISAFPIIEFFDNQFQGFNVNVGDWLAMGTPTGFTFDDFYTLSIALNPITDTFTYTVDGELATTQAAGGTVRLDNVILQGVNRGIVGERTLYFDNLTASSGVSPIPIPATLPLLVAGLSAFGFVALRRKRKVAA